MDKFIGKKRFWAKKRHRNGFFRVFTFYRTKTFCKFIVLPDYAQTYRIVTDFILEGGKTKITPQNSSQFLFATSEISRVSQS